MVGEPCWQHCFLSSKTLEAIKNLQEGRTTELQDIFERATTLGTDVETADVISRLAERANIEPEAIEELVTVTRERIAGEAFDPTVLWG